MKFLILCLVIAVATALKINVKQRCANVDNSFCTIKEIRVEPCKNKNTCAIPRGKITKISFDFVPQFSSNNLTLVIRYNNANWPDFDPVACPLTKCPTEPGKLQTLTKEMEIRQFTPKGNYNVEWSLSDAHNSTFECCFATTFRVK